MPRTGGVYSPPAGTKGVPNATIQSVPYNTLIDDLTADANAARPVTAGGTGATTASGARTALGLEIGTNVQAYDAGLQSISGLATTADQMLYTTGSDLYATTALTPFARTILDDADAAAVRATIGAQASLGYTPVNKAGDTMTGNLTVSELFATGANGLIVRSSGNRNLYFGTDVGVTRGQVFHENASSYIGAALFNSVGASVRSAQFWENGNAYWEGPMFQVGFNSGTAEYRLNAGVNSDYRIVGDTGGQLFVQKSANEWVGATNLLAWGPANDAFFPSHVTATTFQTTANGTGQNFMVGDDAWIGDVNTPNTISIKGTGDPNNGFIRFGSGPNAVGVNGTVNTDRLYWGGTFFMQTDGNMFLPVFGDYLGNIIVSKAGFSVSTNTNETNFPIGQVLSVNTPASAPARRDIRSIYLDGGVAGGYSTVSGSSLLAGTWRQIGNIGSTYSTFQRVA